MSRPALSSDQTAAGPDTDLVTATLDSFWGETLSLLLDCQPLQERLARRADAPGGLDDSREMLRLTRRLDDVLVWLVAQRRWRIERAADAPLLDPEHRLAFRHHLASDAVAYPCCVDQDLRALFLRSLSLYQFACRLEDLLAEEG
jgi:hypothetical protein